MSLFLEGDKETIKRYRAMAETDGLTIRLYSEEGSLPITVGEKVHKSAYKSIINMNPTRQAILGIINDAGSRVRPSVITRKMAEIDKPITSGRLTYHLTKLVAENFVEVEHVSRAESYYTITENGQYLFPK
ncbi:hypothetical protein EPN87_03445 [archaeon]|nr:MAG: hypothetical protein EPN87_03445 [archaeon]